MLRLTKKADYGLMAVKHLAEHADSQAHVQGPCAAQCAKDIGEAYHIPISLLAKILQQLTRAGILVSHSGIHGGYSLARRADQITAFEVIRAIEGPLFITSCVTVHGTCDLTACCTIKEPLQKLNDTIRDLLTGMRISDLCESAAAKEERSRSHATSGRNAKESLVTLNY